MNGAKRYETDRIKNKTYPSKNFWKFRALQFLIRRIGAPSRGGYIIFSSIKEEEEESSPMQGMPYKSRR